MPRSYANKVHGKQNYKLECMRIAETVPETSLLRHTDENSSDLEIGVLLRYYAAYGGNYGRVAHRYSDWLRAGWSGDRIPVGARFFARVQTGPGAHPAPCTMGTGSFLGVKRPGRGADNPPSPSVEVESE
jgi:hypothetical protein